MNISKVLKTILNPRVVLAGDLAPVPLREGRVRTEAQNARYMKFLRYKGISASEYLPHKNTVSKNKRDVFTRRIPLIDGN